MAKKNGGHLEQQADDQANEQGNYFRILEALEQQTGLLRALQVEQAALQAYIDKRLSGEQIASIVENLVKGIAEQVGEELEKWIRTTEQKQEAWEKINEEAFAKHAQRGKKAAEEDVIDLGQAERDKMDRIARSKMSR